MQPAKSYIIFVVSICFGVLSLSCDEQSPPEGKMKCRDDSECPSGWYCDPDEDVCFSNGGEKARDGGDDEE